MEHGRKTENLAYDGRRLQTNILTTGSEHTLACGNRKVCAIKEKCSYIIFISCLTSDDAMHREENTTQTMTCPLGISNETQAIINVAVTIAGFCHLFTLWTSHVSHHHGLVRFQVSDKKLVKHTTEMIL